MTARKRSQPGILIDIRALMGLLPPAQDWFRGPGARHHLCPGPLGSESWAQEPCQEGGLCGLFLQGCSGCVCRSGRGRRTWGREGPPEWLWQLPRQALGPDAGRSGVTLYSELPTVSCHLVFICKAPQPAQAPDWVPGCNSGRVQ